MKKPLDNFLSGGFFVRSSNIFCCMLDSKNGCLLIKLIQHRITQVPNIAPTD